MQTVNAKNAGGDKAGTNEQTYYDALKRIASYQSPTQMRRGAEKQYGLDYEEALEMAYENVLEEAKAAVRGKRRPVGVQKPSGKKAGGGAG